MLICRECAHVRLTEPTLAFLLGSHEGICANCGSAALCAEVPREVERWWKPVRKPTVIVKKKPVQVAVSDNMTVTIHALERMEQRWPKLVGGLDDQEVARLIQGEVNDAFVCDRRSRICPLELVNNYLHNWNTEKDVWFLWTEERDRGYVVLDRPEGVTVMTTLVGLSGEQAKHKLVRRRT